MWLRNEAVRHRVTGMHSACVARNGVGVLLCGDSGAGKTTLAYACAKAGWTYVTDDGSYIVHGRDDLLVVGNSNQIRFRPAGKLLFPELDSREVLQRAETKPAIEINPRELEGIHHSPTAKVKYFVLLNRRDRKNLPLRDYSKEVVREFLRQGRFSPPEMLLCASQHTRYLFKCPPKSV